MLVVSPADPDRYWRVLQTDEAGIARFLPDAPGSWRLEADDGLGHRIEIDLEVDELGGVHVTAVPWGGVPHGWAIAVVAGLILGWIGFQRRRRNRALD